MSVQELERAETPAPPGPPEPAEEPTSRTRVIGQALVLLAIFCLGFLVYFTGLSGLQERRTQDTLYSSFRGQLTNAIAPVTAPIKESAPVAIVQIPRLGVRQVVVEGTSGHDLTLGPGHRRDTPLPGQPGISIIMGRRVAFGAPFGSLESLRPGDRIVTTTGQGVSTFRVLSVRSSDAAVSSRLVAATSLNLMTAASSWAPGHSIIVSAALESQLLPAGEPVAAIGSSEQPLADDPGAAVPLLLWSQALLIVMLAATFAYHRYPRWMVYLSTTPVALAVFWNVYENLARLLPNTL